MQAAKRFGPVVVIFIALLCSSVPAFASITYTCGTNSNNGVSMTSLCAQLNTLMNSPSVYGRFNDVNASIFIDFGNTGLGGSTTALKELSYANWRTALSADSTSADDATSLGGGGSVAATDPFGVGNGCTTRRPSGCIGLTNANARALGFTVTTGGVTTSLTACTTLGVGCYDSVITISNSQPLYYRSGSQGSAYDFFSVVEHETDEGLGTISALTFTCTGSPCSPSAPAIDFLGGGGTNAMAVDVFRYSASNTRAFQAEIGCGGTGPSCGSAYFSINNGGTNIQSYHNAPDGADFGDWAGGCPGSPHVQDAFGCPGASVDIDPNVEVRVLDVIGYTFASATPEPGTFVLLGTALAGAVLLRRRRSV